MSKCGQRQYDMIEFLGIGDMKNGQLYRAQINTIDPALNTADITLLDTCAAPAALTDVPFFYHCEFSTGTVTDLAYGHRAFRPLDEVYALFVPARDNNDPPRFYVVGHVDIWDTRYCVKENFVLLTVKSRNQFPNVNLVSKTVFNMQTMQVIDLVNFINRAGSPPKPTVLPITYDADTELTRPDVLAFHAWFDYNFAAGYSPATRGNIILEDDSQLYSPMTTTINFVDTINPSFPTCGTFKDERHSRIEYLSQPPLFGNPPVKFQETWSLDQYQTMQSSPDTCIWDGSARTNYSRTWRNWEPVALYGGDGEHTYTTIEEQNAQLQTTYSSYALYDSILDSTEDYIDTKNLGTGDLFSSGPYSMTTSASIAESSFGINWLFKTVVSLQKTLSPTYPTGVFTGTWKVETPTASLGTLLSSGTDYTCLGLYIPYEEYTISITNGQWIGSAPVPGNDTTNTITEPNPVKVKLRLMYYNFGPDLPYNTYISASDIISNNNFPAIEHKVETQINLLYEKISERLRAMFPTWNTVASVYMTAFILNLSDKIPQMSNYTRRTS